MREGTVHPRGFVTILYYFKINFNDYITEFKITKFQKKQYFPVIFSVNETRKIRVLKQLRKYI